MADLDAEGRTISARRGDEAILANDGLPSGRGHGVAGSAEAALRSASRPAIGGFGLPASLNGSGTIRYVMVSDGAAAPTAAEVKAGTASGGGAALKSGSFAVGATPYASSIPTVTGLTAGTRYDVYFVAEASNSTPNLTTSPAKVGVKGAAPGNAVPTNSAGPSVSGTATVGNALTATTGTWSDADGDPLSYTYKWYRAEDTNGTDATLISGATTSSYTLTTADAHKYLRVVVTANDGNGGTQTASSFYTAIANSTPVNSAVPSVVGTASVGNALIATTGTWSDADGDSQAYTYQWYRAEDTNGTNAAAITGATTSSYTLTTADAHKYLRVVVRANDGRGGTQTAASTYTAITNSTPANSALPSVSGTATVGNALSTTTGTWSDADGDTLTYTYQWYRASDSAGTGEATITGATTSSYTLVAGDLAKYIRVEVTASDSKGGTQTSSTTRTVVAAPSNAAPTNSVVPSVSGTATVGNALSAANGTWSDADGDSLSYTYQWYRADDTNGTNAASISGATAATYTLTTADAHKYLRVVVTANDGNSHTPTTASTYTAITNSAPANSAVPSVSGTATVGNALSTTNGTWSDADGDTLSYTYQWYRADSSSGTNETAISGATNSSYTLTASEASKYLRVVVTANDSNGSSTQTATSTRTQALDATPPSITGVSIPDSAAKIGDVVTATISVASDNDTYTLGSGSIGGFALGNLSKVSDTSYTATFTVTAGGTDVAAGADIPVNLVLTDSANNSNIAYTTAISQSADAIDANKPALLSANPADDATGVGITQNLVLTFSEPVQSGSGNVTLYKTGVSTAVETFAISDARVTVSGSQITLNPAITLDYSTSYYLEIASGAVTDLAGNIYDGLSGGTSYNFTTASAPPPPQDDPPPPAVAQTTTKTETVDGVVIRETTQVTSDGSVTQTLDVPIVTATRLEENAKTSNADIPLVKDTASGQSLLEASLPVGVGLQVETSTTAATGAGTGLDGLIRAIRNRTESQPDDKARMTSVGQTFLDVLPPATNLTVRTIIPVVADPAAPPAAPIVITGTAPAAGSTQQQAIVIDVRNLPKGTVLQLQNVEFAAIVGDVRVSGGEGSQMVVGDSGSQIIVLGADDDTLRGGGGNDFVGSEGGDDQLWGDEGADTVTGGIGNDVLYGNQQDDFVYGNQGADTIFGGQDRDTVFGGQDGDVLYGNRADDVLYGQLGDDTLFGGQSDDVLWGGQGNDLLAGNLGADTLYGGQGADVFRIGAAEEGGDMVADFEAGVDKIAVAGPNFGDIQAGALSARHFALDNPATTGAQFVFSTRTGVLSFDADGVGAGAAVAIATLNVRTLSANDILVVGSSG